MADHSYVPFTGTMKCYNKASLIYIHMYGNFSIKCGLRFEGQYTRTPACYTRRFLDKFLVYIAFFATQFFQNLRKSCSM